MPTQRVKELYILCVYVNGGSGMCTPLMGLTYILFPKSNIFHLTCLIQFILQTIRLRLSKCPDLSSANAASCYVRLFLIVIAVGISASLKAI